MGRGERETRRGTEGGKGRGGEREGGREGGVGRRKEGGGRARTSEWAQEERKRVRNMGRRGGDEGGK